MKTAPTPTLLYIRQSVTRDKSESIPMQVERCTEAAAHLGAVIVDTLIEPPSTSGYKNRGRSRPKQVERVAVEVVHLDDPPSTGDLRLGHHLCR